MTPFHPDLENDAGHTIDQDDLIAFHLHELSPPQERALRRVLHTHSGLRSESLAIASTLRAFPKLEPSLPLDSAALDRHWNTLRDSLPIHVPPATASRNPFARTLFTRWAFPTLAASALAATALFLSLHHNSHPAPSTLAIATPPPLAAIPANAVPSSSPVPTFDSVPTDSSVSTISISRTPFLNNSTPQAAITIPSSPFQAQPTPNPPITQPIPASPSAEASPANTRIATNQQSTSLTPTPPPPVGPGQPRPASRIHHSHITDVTFAAFANLTPTRSFTSTTGTGASAVSIPYSQAASPSFGVLASFHQQFRPWLGYRITATHSAPSFEYTYSPTASGAAGIVVPENVFELSATYVVQGPHHRRLSTSAEAGAGVLDFHPTNPNVILGVSNSLRSTAVLGISAELALTKHLSLHAGYRALLYKSPPAYLTYDVNIPTPGNLTLSNEPVLGVTYRFHTSSE